MKYGMEVLDVLLSFAFLLGLVIILTYKLRYYNFINSEPGIKDRKSKSYKTTIEIVVIVILLFLVTYSSIIQVTDIINYLE